MNAQIGEIFRACYRYGRASHSDQLRDAKKIRFYADAEIARLEGRPIKTVRPQTTPKPPEWPLPPRTMDLEEYVASTKRRDALLNDSAMNTPEPGVINPFVGTLKPQTGIGNACSEIPMPVLDGTSSIRSIAPPIVSHTQADAEAFRRPAYHDAIAGKLPRRTMRFESPMEEFVAFIKGDN